MAYIKAVEHFVPENVVTNDELSKFMDTSDEWIQTRTGIKERRWVREGNKTFQGLTNFRMTGEAGKKALDSAALKPCEIDAICYATISADNEMPGSGVLFRSFLGITGDIPVFEIRNQCSGFLYALQAARALIGSGKARNVMVVGAEIQSSGLDLSTRGRNTAVLFADGAGVLILSAEKGAGELIDLELFSEGAHDEKLGIRYPGYARPKIIEESDFDGEVCGIYPNMEGRFVFKNASIRMPQAISGILKKSGLGIGDLSVVIPHQANLRIIEMLSAALGPQVKVFSNIQRYGNTTAASIPIALSEASKEGVVKKGDLLGLVSFGAGFSWGAALIRW